MLKEFVLKIVDSCFHNLASSHRAEAKNIATNILKDKNSFELFELVSTKDMKNEDAPEGQVLVQYLEPSWGGWAVDWAIATFDNPDHFEDGGKGWLHWNTGNRLNVIAYCKLPDKHKIKNPFEGKTQKEIYSEYGTYTPNLGNIGV